MKHGVYYVCAINMARRKGEEIMDKYTPEQARKLRGLTQKKMAAEMGLTESTYINKEKGETKFYIDEACKFSEIVKIPLELISFF